MQTSLLKNTPDKHPDRVSNLSLGTPTTPGANAHRAGHPQRTLLSAKYPDPAQPPARTRGGNGLGWNLLSAGDKLRDLIIPESLASVVSAGVWSTGLDKVGIGWGGPAKNHLDEQSRKAERAREELDDLLASACPLCESVVAGLDKPFVREDEEDLTWQI